MIGIGESHEVATRDCGASSEADVVVVAAESVMKVCEAFEPCYSRWAETCGA